MSHRFLMTYGLMALLASGLAVPGTASAGPDPEALSERSGRSRSKQAGTPSEPADWSRRPRSVWPVTSWPSSITTGTRTSSSAESPARRSGEVP